MQISAVVPVMAVFTAGTVLPLGTFPVWIQKTIEFLPTTWFMNSVNFSLGLGNSTWSLPVLWIAMAAVTVGATLLAARIFDWEDEV